MPLYVETSRPVELPERGFTVVADRPNDLYPNKRGSNVVSETSLQGVFSRERTVIESKNARRRNTSEANRRAHPVPYSVLPFDYSVTAALNLAGDAEERVQTYLEEDSYTRLMNNWRAQGYFCIEDPTHIKKGYLSITAYHAEKERIFDVSILGHDIPQHHTIAPIAVGFAKAVRGFDDPSHIPVPYSQSTFREHLADYADMYAMVLSSFQADFGYRGAPQRITWK